MKLKQVKLGAKDKKHIPYLKELRKWSDKLYVSTEDGSYGVKGRVTDLFERANIGLASIFYNCGPRGMIEAVLPIERRISNPDRIFSSLEYITSCGVGLCGKCADDRGRRTCVEGPFMSLE